LKAQSVSRDLGPLAAFFAALALVVACVLWPGLWDMLGVNHENPYFLDLAAILAASDASGAGLDPYAIPSPFDLWGRPHVYGPWWLYLHHLGLGRDDLFWLGALLAVSAMAGVAWALRPRGWAQSLAAALLLASPAMLLAYERGNNDLVIVLMLIAGGVVPSRGAGLAWRAAWMWSAAVLKFYPVAALLVLLRGERPRRLLAAGAAILIATLITLWLWRDDFSRAFGVVPQPRTTYGYGAKLIPSILLGRAVPAETLAYGGAVAVGCALAGFADVFRRRAAEAMTRDTPAGAWFVASGACWSLCYFSNVNFPYRAALLILAGSAWFEMARDGSGEIRAAGRNLVVLLTAALWLPWLHLDFAVATSPSRHPAGFVILGLEHGLVLGLSAGVNWALAWMAYRSLRGWNTRPGP